MKKVMLSALTAGLFFSSCKDDNDPQPTPTTQELLQQKWTMAHDITREFDATQSNSDTTIGAAGNFVQFNTNGTMYMVLTAGGDTSTFNYQLISSDSIVINNRGFDITELNSNSFKLYRLEYYLTPGAGQEEWVHFTR